MVDEEKPIRINLNFLNKSFNFTRGVVLDAPYDIAIYLHRSLLYLLSTIVAKPHISLGPRPLALGPIREGAVAKRLRENAL